MARTLCAARTAAGSPCGMPAAGGTPFCFTHAPELAAERAAARRRGGFNSARAAPLFAPEGAIPLRSVEDVRAALEAVAGDVARLPNGCERGRTLAGLLALALKAIEVGSFDDRLRSVEERMRTLGGQP